MKKLFLPVLVLLFFSACSSSKTENTTPLLEYNITLMQGGGFTGAIDATSIDSAGNVFTFHGLPGIERVKSPKGKLTQEQINSLNSLLPQLVKEKYSQNGNMTTSVILTRENIRLDYSFEGLNPDSKVPSALKNFYETLHKIINNIKE